MQMRFGAEVLVYECPLGHMEYWVEEPPEGYEIIECEVCGVSCDRTGSTVVATIPSLI